jgi:CheY-like chemotaxis protein
MRLLLLEDDAKKREDILNAVREAFANADVRVAASVHSGIAEIEKQRVDVILLDMTMPPFDVGPDEDGDTRHFGGREFLRQLEMRDSLAPIVMVSQFSQFGKDETATTLAELDSELRAMYPEHYRGAIHYSTRVDEWRSRLIEAIRAIAGDARQ